MVSVEDIALLAYSKRLVGGAAPFLGRGALSPTDLRGVTPFLGSVPLGNHRRDVASSVKCIGLESTPILSEAPRFIIVPAIMYCSVWLVEVFSREALRVRGGLLSWLRHPWLRNRPSP